MKLSEQSNRSFFETILSEWMPGEALSYALEHSFYRLECGVEASVYNFAAEKTCKILTYNDAET